MKYSNYVSGILAGTLALTVVGCSQPAEANVGVTAGYQNNNVIDKDGLVLGASTVTKNNVKLGVNTFTDVDNSRLLSYGVSAGVPVHLQNTPITVTPSVGVDYYRVDLSTLASPDNTKGAVGNLGLDFDYKFDTTTYATIQTKYSKAFDSDKNLKGESYMFGITKLFK